MQYPQMDQLMEVKLWVATQPTTRHWTAAWINNRMLSALWHVACGYHALASCKLSSCLHNCYSARYAQHEATSWRALAATYAPNGYLARYESIDAEARAYLAFWKRKKWSVFDNTSIQFALDATLHVSRLQRSDTYISIGCILTNLLLFI
jgi:hypothetical protein